MAKPSSTSVGCDKWPLSNALWMKFYISHGKYRLELNEYFHMYWCQLNFALFCAASALGISWQHLSHPNLLVRSVYTFHVYFHVQLILHDLGIPLPHEDGFSKVKNAYINRTVHIAVSVMAMELMQTKHGYMEIGFIRLLCYFWSWGKSNKKIPTRQSYAMGDDTV